MMHFSNQKILHLDDNHPVLVEELEVLGFENHFDFISTKEEIESKIKDYQGIIIRSRFKIDRVFLEKAINLEFIARVGAGLENIDCAYAASRNIALIAAPEGNSNAVGEHTLAMLLSLFNNLNAANSEVKNAIWQREQNRGHELDGKVVGIIGYGNMGKSFAKKLRGFDCEVLCFDIKNDMGDANAKQVSLLELQQKADVISLHIPLDKSTDGLVNQVFINNFSKPFWLINTARGKNVVTKDVVEALQSQKILGVALDVLEYEKSSFENLTTIDLPDDFKYLTQSKNVLLSPHIAGWTFESHKRLAAVIVEKITNLYWPKTAINIEKRVTGIGGVFLKSKNPLALKNWYAKHLGLNTDEYGATFWWKDQNGLDCSTQWSVFDNDSSYFAPSEKPFMQNFRVENLEHLLETLQNEGVPTVDKMACFDYGKFAWIIDIDGNKIELWEPNDKAFL